ncbi:NAD(P)/FAD-dependent oxidoreductase [Parachitinimonas caeni]|uniref:FAD-dependent oxidoreductase n=1 Tax=Parachitinimonas caeni TaxID=3031301 RepID=A0ABT7DWV8_9NEIS|nr:FAD-dependent oxidoreductase [Parachitinimonas caeni]MDK2124545.1 FAD-dependent oxidoreductase [Parachitinimonas caeni]
MSDVLILGSGLAGYTVAREFRKLAPDASLTLLSADSAAFYSKPMLSNGLAANKTAESLAMKSAEQMATELKAAVRPGSRVEQIDPVRKVVKTASGEYPYGKLVLALGADPFTPPMQGDAVTEVLTVNDLSDYGRFRAALLGKRSVILLGGGLIGCEFANDLVTAGFEVTVIDPMQWPLSRLLPQAAGEFMMRQLETAGITLRLGEQAAAVNRTAVGYQVTLAGGDVLEADLVLSAIGLRPRIALAAAAGIKTARGIVVDRHLQTSDPAIFALGDCAEVEGLVLPFVLPIMNAARALAPTLAGTPTPVRYPAMPVVVKTPACPTVVSPPAIGSAGEWRIEPEDGGIAASFMSEDGALLGFALLGTATARKQALTGALPPVLA